MPRSPCPPRPHDCVTVEARVAAVHADGRLGLEIDDASLCRGCSGVCLWRRLAPVEWAVDVAAAPDLAVGSRVAVSVPGGLIVGSAAVVHGAPWAALLAGALAGQWLLGGDAGAAVGAAAGAALAVSGFSRLRARLESVAASRLTIRPKP